MPAFAKCLALGLAVAAAMRQQQDEELGEASEASALQARAREPDGFHCPTECSECCEVPLFHRLKVATLGSNDEPTDFRCILRAATDELPKDRKCSQPRPRKSAKSEFKADCAFKPAEAKAGADSLRPCKYEPTVTDYQEFLGDNTCGVKSRGGGVIGTAIDYMYFSVAGSKLGFGGVCRSKSSQFRSHGMLREICKGRPVQCFADVTNDLCNQLKDDRAAGRLDDFIMAVWAVAIEPMWKVKRFPAPKSQPRVLRKFTIPGWAARQIAWETPPGDLPIDLQSGGFMCMMRKLQAIPVTDEMVPERNSYVSLDNPAPGQRCIISPRKPADVLRDYFQRFQAYPAPLHFDVPAQELLTDATLEKLVFRSIGAHRLEVYDDQGRYGLLNPVGLDGVLADPKEKAAHLEQLPVAVRTAVRFAVRLEHLVGDLPVREGMGTWGGNAFFSGEGKLLALQYQGETAVPDHKRWDAFKFVFRSSLVNVVTCLDHLVSTHILASETLSLASYESLPPEHGLRQLLEPFNWGALTINFKAGNNLFPKAMLVHRATPFTDEVFQGKKGADGLLWQRTKLLRYRLFSETYAAFEAFRKDMAPDMPEVPFFADGMLFYQAMQRYVSAYVHAMYHEDADKCSALIGQDIYVARFTQSFFGYTDGATPDFWPSSFRNAAASCDSLIALLSELLFLVTGWHRHVGTVFDFFRDTRFAATAWKDGELQARPKHTLMAETLAATTNADLPKVTQGQFHMFSSGKLSKVHKQFVQEMHQVQAEVERRNLAREQQGRMPFRQMEPAQVDYGVMV